MLKDIPRAYGGVSGNGVPEYSPCIRGCFRCVIPFVGFYLNLKEKGRMI